MSKTILNINGDKEIIANKSNMRLFARSIKHSFKTTEQRQNIKDVIAKTNALNLTYFNGEFGYNDVNISDQLVEKLEQDLAGYRAQWEKGKANGSKNIPWDKMINGGNNNNVFNETIIGFSNDFYTSEAGFIDKDGNIDYEKAQGYFDWELDRYKHNFKEVSGHDLNIIGATLHLDETTPHIHLFTHNVYYEQDNRSDTKRWKVSFKARRKDQYSKLQELQETTARDFLKDNYNYNEVEQRKVKYGEVYDPKNYERHSVKEWKAQYAIEKQNQINEIENLKEQNSKLSKKLQDKDERIANKDIELDKVLLEIESTRDVLEQVMKETNKNKILKKIGEFLKLPSVIKSKRRNEVMKENAENELNKLYDKYDNLNKLINTMTIEKEQLEKYINENKDKYERLEQELELLKSKYSKLENDLDLSLSAICNLQGINNNNQNKLSILKDLRDNEKGFETEW